MSFPTNQKGSVLPLVAVSLSLLLMMVAFAIDFGWLILVKSELQAAADSAALAGAAQLIDEDLALGVSNQLDDIIEARDFAEQFAGLNTAANRFLLLDRNDANDISGGIVVGYIQNPLDLTSPFQTVSPASYNSVRVDTELSQNLNGPLAMFFGGVTGLNTLQVSARSVATVDDRVVGFSVRGLDRLDLLPFSLSADAWDGLFATASASSTQFWRSPYGPVTCLISVNPLLNFWGITCTHPPLSLKMYPNNPQAPGNFGTINIGPNNNSTSHLIDQILNGITADDIEVINGIRLTDDDGDGIFTQWFSGDTGVSSAMKSALTTIRGEPRILPLHRNITGTGNGTNYEVCRFVGVKIIRVRMTGALQNRYVEVVPAQILSPEAIVNPNAPSSRFVFALALTQ